VTQHNHDDIQHKLIRYCVVTPSVNYAEWFMLSVIHAEYRNKPFMMSVIYVECLLCCVTNNPFMLNVIMLNAIMLNVVAAC
jgi:hypothetical protein